MNLAEINLQQKFVNEWHTELQSVSNLRTYMCFKSDFILGKYIAMGIIKPRRSVLAQFRSGVLPIRIETRPLEKGDNNRRWILCSAEAIIEDEFQF